jgi:DNA-binding NarL/FixJ family response regulator
MSISSEPIRTIIADDHEIARSGIRNALVDQPRLLIVAEVSNGPELMTALQSTHPDFLILDVAMPGFDPLSAIQEIRASYPALRILVVSAYDDDIYVQGLLSAGVNGYHLKDQSLSDLKLAVGRVIDGESWISSPLIRKLVNPEARPGSLELSSRQIDIARCLANGMSNRETADHLNLSVKTIENHLTRLYHQLHVNSRLEAANLIHDHPELLAQPGRALAQDTVEFRMPALNQTSIVVVDDNRRYRKQLGGMIGRFFPDIMLYEAQNWSELLGIIQQVVPALVFLDVVLGEEDGISCTRKLKLQVPSTKVILISAYPDREFHRRGVESGATAFIDKKNLDSATIRQIIQDCLAE